MENNFEDWDKVFKLQKRLRSTFSTVFPGCISVWMEETEESEESTKYALEASLVTLTGKLFITHRVASEYIHVWTAEEWQHFEDNCIREFEKCLT